jgi:hypothetical protein
MDNEIYYEKLIELTKKRWLELVTDYATKALKMFKCMQKIQSQREDILLLDNVLDKLYQADSYFRYYKPTQDPIFIHPFDNDHPDGNYSNRLEEEFNYFVRNKMRDEFNDLENDEYFFTGSLVSDYVRELSEYYSISENIFNCKIYTKVQEPVFSNIENSLIELHSQCIQETTQSLIDDEFEKSSEIWSKMTKDALQERKSKRTEPCYEYADNLKRMIFCMKQVSDLRDVLKKEHFFTLCIIKGKNYPDDFLFNDFYSHEDSNAPYDEYWWQNDPFKTSSELFIDTEEEFLGFEKILKSKFKDELERLNCLSDENSKIQYKYLNGLSYYGSIYKPFP